jgi:hypothetical protein
MSQTLVQPATRARLSLDLDLVAKSEIENLRKRTGATSITELIRKSVALYDIVSDHKAAGGSLIFRHSDGREERLVIL